MQGDGRFELHGAQLEFLGLASLEDTCLSQVVQGINLQYGPSVGYYGAAEWELNARSVAELELAIDVGDGESANTRVIHHVLKVHDKVLIRLHTQEHVNLNRRTNFINIIRCRKYHLVLTYFPVKLRD